LQLDRVGAEQRPGQGGPAYEIERGAAASGLGAGRQYVCNTNVISGAGVRTCTGEYAHTKIRAGTKARANIDETCTDQRVRHRIVIRFVGDRGRCGS
jgi:hypothetical protein